MLSLDFPSYAAVDHSTWRRAPSPPPLSPSSVPPLTSSRNINACARARFPRQDMKYNFSSPVSSPVSSSLSSSKPTPTSTPKRFGKNRAGQAQSVSPRQHMDAEQDRRRNDFLRKVRQAGDDQRWRSRGDRILREDYVSRQKRWEEEQAKSAPEILMAPEAEETEVWQESCSKAGVEMEIMDDILQREGQELDTLISRLEEITRLEESGSTTMEQEEAQTTEDYGSDDEDYIWLCTAALSEMEARDAVADSTQEATPGSFHDMDMSSG